MRVFRCLIDILVICAFVAGGVPACSVPQDGCPILHYQGQGQTGQTGPQKDLHLRCLYTDKPVSNLLFYQSHFCAAHLVAMMSEFLHLNNHVDSNELFNPELTVCSNMFVWEL